MTIKEYILLRRKMNNNIIPEKRKHIFQKQCYVNFFIIMLVLFMFFSPLVLWRVRLWYDHDETHIDENIVYENSWLGFFGSYLGGVLGGGATLLALVSTINNSKKEQARNDEKEKQKIIQRSAFIIYLDLQFTFENIIEFVIQLWKEHGYILKCLSRDNTICESLYSNPIFNQFYFDRDWLYRVADLSVSSDFDKREIKKIGEIYGHLMNIRNALDTRDTDSCEKACLSMNSLINFQRIDKGKDDDLLKMYDQFKVDGDINKAIEELMTKEAWELMVKLEKIAFGE